jgi:hypothetical protein
MKISSCFLNSDFNRDKLMICRTTFCYSFAFEVIKQTQLKYNSMIFLKYLNFRYLQMFVVLFAFILQFPKLQGQNCHGVTPFSIVSLNSPNCLQG